MQSIPITILAGSDHVAGRLPETGADLHALAAYKGAEITMGGRSLIEILVENIEHSGGFGPVTIVGPSEIYAPLNLKARIVDSNGSVATNLRAAFDDHLRENGEEEPIALLAYDIIVSSDELDEARKLYDCDRPCAAWMPFVHRPQDENELGAFGWKPTYTFRSETGDHISILPGHLGILYPDRLRLTLLYKLLDLAYQTRNHSVTVRCRAMVKSVLAFLLRHDLRMITVGKIPRLTAQVITNGLRIAIGVRKQTLSIEELERSLAGILIKDSVKNPENNIRHPVVGILGLAEDVDTEEEAKMME